MAEIWKIPIHIQKGEQMLDWETYAFLWCMCKDFLSQGGWDSKDLATVAALTHLRFWDTLQLQLGYTLKLLHVISMLFLLFILSRKNKVFNILRKRNKGNKKLASHQSSKTFATPLITAIQKNGQGSKKVYKNWGIN